MKSVAIESQDMAISGCQLTVLFGRLVVFSFDVRLIRVVAQSWWKV